MVTDRLNTDIRSLLHAPSRRDVLRGLAGAGLGLGSAPLPGFVGAGKTRKKRKRRKKKCGKAGGKPVKGKCCKRSIRVDGRCRRCDVCARGCAFASVQAAIEAAAAGDTIAICPGTYGGDLKIAKNLTLVGAGDGARSGNTIVDGAGAGRVVLIAEGSTVTLQHLRVTGGNGGNGGGLYNAGGRVELIGCTVSGNAADLGGGVYNVGGTLLIASAISENKSGGNGGGIYNYAGGTVELIDCTVSRNTGAADSAGGGIFNGDGTLTLRNSTVSENEAGNSGGGVYNGGALNLIASEIRGNRASDGGGLFNRTTVTADAASRIRANTAANQGGGIYSSLLGTTTLASSAIVTGNSPNNCAGLATVPNCIG